ncbi:carcinoembryonic antigen-related cell adhesion molecule 6-like [Poecilia formosa]|uniref:carcinoembryonic antigen-related cell adhesion molecule 6-like n=1 Tax=Poecilia formosa TaxID=48698 RepID=UPI0007B7C0BD|nr:PREDICTED: carcinoembryonic antigen-related cell adhesion molecule 6-like [Poecilia formosa]
MLRLFFIVSVIFKGLSDGAGVLPDGPLIASVGGAITFTTNLTSTETPFELVTWQLISGSTPKFIISSHTTVNTTGPEYEGRITLFRSTGSLELRNLKLSDSGEYIVTIQDGMDNPTGRTTLDVYEPVSNVRVSTLNTDLIEFNSSINLSCSSSGRSLSFIWMKNNSEVTTNDRVQITTNGENSNLTIVNVTRNDQGSYSCNVSNPVSSVISAPVNISVYYGPEKTNLRSPSQKYPEGSNIHLSCSADSRPNASFNWFFNGNDLPHSESQRKLLNVQKNQSGNYSCQAFNSRTSKYEISQISVIYIEDISTEGSIHPGAIAGIVIGCVVCISLIVLGVYFILKKK